MNSLDFSGAEILSGEGGDGNAECSHDHPENTVDFAVSRPCSDGICAETVDACLNDQVGNRVHGGLNTRRQSDPHNAYKNMLRETYLLKSKLIGVFGAHKGDDGHGSADRLGNDGGYGHSGYSHPQDNHEKQVQNNVDKTGSNEEIKRTFGIPHCSKNTGCYIINKGRNRSDKIDCHVGDGRPHDIIRGVHPSQSGGGNQNAYHSQNGAAGNGQRNGSMYGVTDLLILACTVKLSDDYCRTGGKTGKKAHQKVDNGGCRTSNGGKSLFAYKVSHNNSISGIIKLLKESTE